MKVCSRCNQGYNDNVNFCPRCGNRNLIYVNNGAPQQPMYGSRPSNFKFGDFFKDYFRSPLQAKKAAGDRKDIGTGLIFMGATFFLYFLYFICLQGGISIRYGISAFSAVITLVYPLVLFILVFGLQYADVILYCVYANARQKKRDRTGLAILIYNSTSRLFPLMIAFFGSLVTLVSPKLGVVFIVIAEIISVLYTAISAKLEYGMKPVSLLDSFMFAVTGIVSYLILLGCAYLLVYTTARSAISLF